MIAKSLGVHLGTIVVAAAVAAQAWLSDPTAKDADSRLPIWEGKPEQLERLSFTSDDVKLVLEAQRDEHGTYFVAELDRKKPQPPSNPHEPPREPDGAGEERELLRFIAVSDAHKLAAQLAPLEAIRELGKLADDRAADFGFDAENPARLEVVIAGAPHQLTFGDKAPGGGDRYVKTPDGQAYVIEGQIARDLESAEGRLKERNLESWEDDEVASVKIVAPSGQRELVRSTGQRGFWGDAQSPGDKDETASNWMDKFGRLRVVEYGEQPAPNPEPLFSVVFFAQGGRQLGSIDVASRPDAGEDGKPQYVARSQQTRWWGRVLSSTAEQLLQDVDGVVRQ